MDVKRALRRHRVTVIFTGFMLVIIFVPVVPYSPSCEHQNVIGPVFLAPAYRRAFTGRLHLWGIPYIAVDGLVLVRFWDWFADPDDRLINAAGKAFYSLVDEGYGAEPTRLPLRVRELIARSTDDDGWVERDRELVRAVAIEGF